MLELWNNELYRQIVSLVFGSLILLAVILYFVKQKNQSYQAGWASIVSWLFVAPVLTGLVGLRDPWQIVVFTSICVLGAKIFFQMTGMYHRSNFVWATYIGIIALGVCIESNFPILYAISPMLFLGFICLIPIIRDSAKQMIQYLSLSLLCFSFLGWSLMHMGWLLKLRGGPLMFIYIIILTEVFDNLHLFLSRYVGRIKMFSKIHPKRNLESLIFAAALTCVFAWALRQLLPVRNELFWMTSALIACFAGSLGDLTLSVIRRDLGIKDVGAFIIGRGDLLTILDRLVFVAPIYYYTMSYLIELNNKGLL